jgi:hypothetical protein
MKTTKWWWNITSFFECGLPVLKILLKSIFNYCLKLAEVVKSSQVSTLPKAKSKTRSKQNKDMHKCSSVYSERGVPPPGFDTASSWSHHGSWRWRWERKIFLRPENLSTQRYYEICKFGRLIRHDYAEIWGLGMDIFHTCHWCFRACSLWPAPVFSCV